MNQFVVSGKLFERLREEGEELTSAIAYKKALLAEQKLKSSRAAAPKLIMCSATEVQLAVIKDRMQPFKANRMRITGPHIAADTHIIPKVVAWKRANAIHVGHLKSVCIKRKSNEINFFESDSNDNDDEAINSNIFSNVCYFSQISMEQPRVGFACVHDFAIISIENGVQGDSKIYSVPGEDFELGSNVYVLTVEFDGVKLDVTCDTGALNLIEAYV